MVAKSVSKRRRELVASAVKDSALINRRKAELVLEEAERAHLIRWARRARTGA